MMTDEDINALIQRRAEGKRRCPNCGTIYTPVLERKHPEMRIQDEFPNAPAWQREQHLSGICSDACWDEFLGVPE